MLTSWILAAAVAAGLGLGAAYLAGRRLPAWGRAAGWAHGAAGTIGTGLVVATWWAGNDPKGSGALAAVFLAAALAGGAVIAAAHWRSRRPPGMALTLHAVFGAGGFLLLLAWQGW